MLTYRRLHEICTERERTDILRLLIELYGNLEVSPTREQINVSAKKNSIWIAQTESGEIVGMATLVIYPQFAKTIAVAEDVVVMPEYRNQGAGQNLMRLLEWGAKDAGAQNVNLITDQERTAACSLYEKVGYKKRDKINYRLDIPV